MEDRDGKADSEHTPLVRKGRQSAYMSVVLTAAPFLTIYAMGLCFFTYFVEWPFLTANYVSAQMITTIGYGDFTVKETASKVFMGFYAILVVLVLAYYHSLVLGSAIGWECEVLRKKLRRLEVATGAASSQGSAGEKFGSMNLAIVMLVNFLMFLLFGCIFFRFFEHCTCSYGLQSREGCSDPDFETCMNTGGYVKDWASSFYMSAITLTTIGFGDYQPRTSLGRTIGIVWMVLGTASTAATLGTVSKLLFESAKEMKIDTSDALNIDDATFKRIDRNHDGVLSRGDFLAYTVVKHGLVQPELMDQINAIYDQLDPSHTNQVTMATIRKAQAAPASA